MALSTLPPEVTEAIRILDAASVDWPEEMVACWKRVRGHVRHKQSESRRVLPAVSLVAQEIAQTRNHAQAALDAMEGVFGHDAPPEEEEEVDTKRLRRPPEEDRG